MNIKILFEQKLFYYILDGKRWIKFEFLKLRKLDFYI